jgi:hypothetical protein
MFIFNVHFGSKADIHESLFCAKSGWLRQASKAIQ